MSDCICGKECKAKEHDYEPVQDDDMLDCSIHGMQPTACFACSHEGVITARKAGVAVVADLIQGAINEEAACGYGIGSEYALEVLSKLLVMARSLC